MKQAYSTLAALLVLASVAAAGNVNSYFFTVPLDVALTYGSDSDNTVRGRVVEVLIDPPTAGVTGSVTVTTAPFISTMAAVTLATGTISNDFTVRPAVDMTDNAGVALTSDPPEHPMLYGETVTFSVTNSSATNAMWRCFIKTVEE